MLLGEEGMDDLIRYRERALELRRLADFGTEGELRSQVRQLAAEIATWVVNVEIQRMTDNAPPNRPEDTHTSRLWRAWRPWARRRTPAFESVAPA
jgi:hypothetical protein